MFRLRCDETGDRSLDRAGAQGEKDPVDRKDHLIDPETFGADRAGEKDPVEKAEDAGEETGGCEKNCSGEEWMGLMGRRHGSSEMAEGFGYTYVGAGE